MLRVANRVKESTLTSGSGTIALGGALNGYQSFSSVLSNGDTSYYTIVNIDSWEVGIGTYSSNTLSRDVVLSSSNSNNKLDLNGQSYVFIAYPSEKSVYKDEVDRVVAGSSGILINGGTPGNVSGVLYNANSILYFNGYPLSVSGHLHSTSDITNFASGVSGLLPVVSITGGYGVGVTNTSGNHTIYSTLTTVSESYSLVTTVFNRNGSVLPKFSVVYISGGQGDLPTVTLALANGEPKSSKTFGITKEEIPAMSSGHVVVYGNIYGIDTDQFNINAPHGDVNGRILYLSPTVSGGLTIDKPYAPNHLVSVGTVIRTHQNEGVFNVRIQNGFELEELHNVATTGVISGQFLKYNGGFWRNTGILSSDISDFSSAVSGISPNISISGTSGISVDKNGNVYTISATGSFGLTSSQVQQLLNSGVSINVLSGTGNFNVLSVTGTPVSLSGHTHLSSSITNFNSSVSGLLNPYALLSSGNFTNLYVNGTTVSVSGHTHTTSQIVDFNSSVSGLINVKNITGSGYVSVTSSAGNFTIGVTGLQPSGNYSVSGHQHNVSDITNFNSGVSGLLPFTGILGSGYVTLNSFNRILTIGVTGLQPSGNYSISGHTHTTSNITDFNSATSGLLIPYALLNSGNFTNLFVAGTPVSLSGHTHTSSNITNFNSSVSGLLPSVSGSGYARVLLSNNVYTVSITGLQPSGNYSISGHQHASSDITNFNSSVSGLLAPYALLNSGNFTNLFVTGTPVSLSGHQHISSDITNFNSSVSGLLPITSIVGTSGASASLSGTTVTVAVTGSFGLTSSGIQDLLNSGVTANITGGSGNFSTLSVNGTGVSTSGHVHTSNEIIDFNSAVSGLLPVKDILPGTNVTITSNSGIYTINSSGGGGGGGSVSVSDPGSGRLLASDGTSSGIIGQSGLTFINNNLTANGVIINNGNNLYMWSNFR